MPEWLTTDQAAEELGYHPEVIRQMLRDQRLKGQHFGRTWMVSARSVAAYRAANRHLRKHDPRRGRTE